MGQYCAPISSIKEDLCMLLNLEFFVALICDMWDIAYGLLALARWMPQVELLEIDARGARVDLEGVTVTFSS